MGSKVLLVLVVFMATILLISAEVAPNEYENFDKKDGKPGANGVDESKWGYWGGPWYGGWGGPWRGGWGGPWYGGGWDGPLARWLAWWLWRLAWWLWWLAWSS
ncbi:glycine-rich RNA-binding, abscisic acid-inducible protein [Spatholobus suberectus]|nr:glycine-rich RNA-binding, abscisic acid-inducible protein [Spatholobus suberectus]